MPAKKKQEITTVENTNLVPPSPTREIDPSTWSMIHSMIEMSEQSGIKRMELVKKCLFAYENNLGLSTAFNGGIYSVNGRIEAEGNVIRAKIDSLPDRHIEVIKLDGKGCTLAYWRKASNDWPYTLYDDKAKPGEWVRMGEASFTEDDAKQAELSKGDNYKKYPVDMYFNRATSRIYKRFDAGLFNSPTYIRGEIQGHDLNVGLSVQQRVKQLADEYGMNEVLAACGNQLPQNHDDVDRLELELNTIEGE